MIRRFRKKPVVIEAVRWTGMNIDELWALDPEGTQLFTIDGNRSVMVRTIEGAVIAVMPGHYVIKGTRGEFYPCDAAAFADIYEPAIDAPRVGVGDEGVE